MKYDTKQVINEIIEQQTQEQEMFTEMANVAVDEDKNVTLQVNVRDNFNVDYFSSITTGIINPLHMLHEFRSTSLNIAYIAHTMVKRTGF